MGSDCDGLCSEVGKEGRKVEVVEVRGSSVSAYGVRGMKVKERSK